MKKFLPTIVFAVILLTGIAAIILTFQLAGHYSKKAEEAAECPQTGRLHRVSFRGDQIQPNYTQAKLCDKLIIANEDDKLRLIAFGEHDEHRSYDGVSERVLEKGQSLVVTLRRAGEFNFHDHFNENLEGTFTVIE